MFSVSFDHCVIHVTDWEKSNAFYQEVMGAKVIAKGPGFSYRFGAFQLNCHGPGVLATPLASIPVPPGGSDLCFEWHGDIQGAIAHLQARQVPVELGPVERSGAKGAGHSVYFRDPDGSLLEFISYM